MKLYDESNMGRMAYTNDSKIIIYSSPSLDLVGSVPFNVLCFYKLFFLIFYCILFITHGRVLLGKFPGFGRGVSSHTLSGLKSLLGTDMLLTSDRKSTRLNSSHRR